MTYEQPHTGTTVVAVTFKDGVVLGADTRVSMGTYISNRASNKLTPLTDNVWMARSGSAADAQAITDYVRHWAGQSESELGRSPSVTSVANLVKLIQFNNKQLVGFLLVTGWDNVKGGQLYCLPMGGTLTQQKWGTDGSGSPFILGYLDSAYREGLNQEEAEEVVVTALTLAMTRDGSSGGMIRLAVSTKDGSQSRLIPGDRVQKSWDE